MASNNTADDTPFPWEVGVFDAHCHPTDTMTSIAAIPHMKASTLTIMATRGEDQHLVEQVASQLGRKRREQQKENSSQPDGQIDSTERVIPCFGWHPWFAHHIHDDLSPTTSSTSSSSSSSKIAHYRNVLTGSSAHDDAFFLALPDPKPLSTLLAETRTRLLAHPTALVGEVGLDKTFRVPNVWKPEEIQARDGSLTPGAREGRTLSIYRVTMNHQKALLKAQLQLAGELRRAVSIHSVHAHGAVLELLQELWRGHERKVPSRRERRRRRSAELAHEESDEEKRERNKIDGNDRKTEQDEDQHETQEDSGPLPFPPRICMHSYSGPAEPLKQFLHPSVPSDIYFSFSTVINFPSSSNRSVDKVVEVIKALPDDRILIESDIHCAGQQMDDLLEEVARTVCQLRGWTLAKGVKQLAENWRRFVFG
ncbi:hypothetical protein VTN77DRAFT_4342 [Rasamsonia byssochlamydoides]|uniref:uncharacterized protein n=1 Tax=Rasamsonia byssochlamydoides TaxID=89139 RepID=UPI00374252BD